MTVGGPVPCMVQELPDDRPDLPRLTAGLQELTGEDRLTGPLQTLVLDHLLRTGGEAVWVDANGHATTHRLARLAPDSGLLDRIHVARGFTHTQHHGLVDQLDAVVDAETTLVVCPAVDVPYRTDCPAGQGETLCLRSLATLATLARDHGLPILLTCSQHDDLAVPVSRAARRTIRVEQTKQGPRFVGEEFETLVYPAGADGYAQTTLRYWARLLTARHPAVADSGVDSGTEPTRHAISEGA